MERTAYRMPTHPGDVVKEELEERGISPKEFASRTGISYTMLNEILNSKRPITSEIALVKNQRDRFLWPNIPHRQCY